MQNERRRDYPDILARLDMLTQRMEEHQASDNRIFEAIQKNLNRLNDAIVGDGDKIGLAEKIRTVEKVQEKTESAHGHIKAIWGAVTVGIIEFFYRTFFHHHQN